jgi:hypothetical protein
MSPDHRAPRRVGPASWPVRFARLFLATLREIADEGAYGRHLSALGRTPSAEEWRRFSERRLLAKYARPKCC